MSRTILVGGPSAIGDLALFSGEVDYNSNGTIIALTLSGATFDACGGAGGFTVTNASIYAGSKFLDPAHRCIMSNAFKAYYDLGDLQLGASNASYLTVHN
jgi:hypothetical protein